MERHSGAGVGVAAGAAALVGAGVGVEPPAAESAGRHLRCRGFRRSGSGLPALRAFAAAVCLRFSDFRRFRSEVHSLWLISQCQCTGLSREQCTVWGSSSTRPTRVAEAVVERTVDSTPLLLSRTDIRIVMSVVIISSRQNPFQESISELVVLWNKCLARSLCVPSVRFCVPSVSDLFQHLIQQQVLKWIHLSNCNIWIGLLVSQSRIYYGTAVCVDV